MWAEDWLETLLGLQGVVLAPSQRKALHRALELLGNAPPDARTLTDLTHSLQDQTLRDGLHHYTLGGALGGLFDATTDSLGTARFQVFEMEHLMNMGEKNLVPVLLYVFHRIDQRLDAGTPTLLVIDEAWVMLAHSLFGEKIEEWLRTLRKKNAAVVFASQSISEVVRSSKRDVVIESCPTKIFLPNPEAATEHSSALYRALGLTERQIEILGTRRPEAAVLLRLSAWSPARGSTARSARARVHGSDRPRGFAASEGARCEGRGGMAGYVATGAWVARLGSSDGSRRIGERRAVDAPREILRVASGARSADDFLESVRSQVAVIDGANLAQNTISAIELVVAVVQRVTIIAQQLEQLKNMIQNTENFPAGTWDAEALPKLLELGEIIQQGNAVAYRMANLDAAFRQRWPGYVPPDDFNASYDLWTTSTLDTIRGVLRSNQLQADEFLSEETRLQALQALSDSSVGRMQAIQAGNMIAARRGPAAPEAPTARHGAVERADGLHGEPDEQGRPGDGLAPYLGHAGCEPGDRKRSHRKRCAARCRADSEGGDA